MGVRLIYLTNTFIEAFKIFSAYFRAINYKQIYIQVCNKYVNLERFT